MKRNILVIDDDKCMLELTQFFLNHAGFEVRIVADGVSAIEELGRHNYDLLLLDIGLPNMDGMQVLKYIRAQDRLKKMAIVMFTASRDIGHLMSAKRIGISDYIVKPPQRSDLVARVERILGSKTQIEEMMFDPNWSLAQGRFEIAVTLKSLSHREAVICSPIPLEKNYILETLNLNVLNAIGVKHLEFEVTDCVHGESGYEYTLSLHNIDRASQDKIRDWVLSKLFEAKARARLVAARTSETR